MILSNLLLFKNHVYDKSFNFSKITNIYNKYFGKVLPADEKIINASHNTNYSNYNTYKDGAVINDIKQSHEKGQPVLVGTISIEKSEKLSDLLRKEGIKHEVLNAKYHEKEAEIIAQAGKFGTVTIATNMAGRGTDIMLGGNSEYLAKQEMRKFGYSEDQIEQATAFNETDDQEVLASRNKFKELKAKYDNEIKEYDPYMSDRLKALDMLNKMDGQYTTKIEGNLAISYEEALKQVSNTDEY